MKRDLGVLERTESAYSTYAPDLRECASRGEAMERVDAHMCEAIGEHPQFLRADDHPDAGSVHMAFPVAGA